MTALIEVLVPRPYVLTLNDRGHWAKTAESTKTIRRLAAYAKLNRHRSLFFDRAECVCTIAHPTARHRDAHNWMPTVKAAIDGLVSGPTRILPGPWPFRLLPDDSDAHLIGPDLRNAVDRSLTHAIRLELRFTEVLP